MLNETVKALETSVCELTYFFAFEFAPTLAVEAKVETFQVLAGYEIDEAITYVAVVLPSFKTTFMSHGRYKKSYVFAC